MSIDWNTTYAAIWRQHKCALLAVGTLDPEQLDMLVGIERQKQELLANTKRFLAGQPGNKAMPVRHRAKKSGRLAALCELPFGHSRPLL